MTATDKEWRRKNPDAYRSIILKHRYGITVEDFNKMLEAQNNVCAICKNKETIKGKSNLSIDHCHDTRKVRGLLCDSCNKGIGFFKNSPEFLNNAYEYIIGV